MKPVLASIVTWNHGNCVAACIDSLLQQTYSSIEIVVLDNASADNTREVLSAYKDRIRIIHSSENRGFCGGHNQVISQTKSDYVLLVNPDIILKSNYIEQALTRIESDPGIGTVCGLLIQSNFDDPRAPVDGMGLDLARNRRFVLRGHGLPLDSLQLRVEEVFGCDGALPLYRRSMIEDLSVKGQFFDEMFFAHKEDHDISWRAQRFGWKTVFDPACVAIHPRVFRPGDLKLRKRLAPEIKFHAAKNDLLLLLKNEDGSNFLKDFFRIVPRRLGIFFYILLFERPSLKSYTFVLKNWRAIWRMRKVLLERRKVSPSEIRSKFLK